MLFCSMQKMRMATKCITVAETQLKCLCLSYRYGSQNALRRKPIRVLTNTSEPVKLKAETLNKLVKDSQIPVEEKLPVAVTPEQKELTSPKKKVITVPAYVKLPEADDRFLKLLATLKSRNLREKSGKILLEGKRLINDAISAGIELKTLFFSKEETLAEINIPDASKVELYKVLYRSLKAWSGVKTCPGIFGVFKQPTNDVISVLTEPTLPVTVLCDNIRDPGNMGSIIRTAAAAGCRNILLGKGCVDPWEQKVLRTGMGAHFRIPINNEIAWDHMINYLPRSSTLYIADNSADIDLLDSDFIDCYEETDVDDTEERYVYKTEEGENAVVDPSYVSKTHLEKYKDLVLPCYLYSSVKYPKDDIVVYVGGETDGVSPQANKLACELGGHRVKIPVENGVESLNCAFALAIILYEIKRRHKETYVFRKN